MKIKELHIQNYKSLVDLKIVEPNPFTVFVGPNGAGKSNIFEALEFLIMCNGKRIQDVVRSFGGVKDIINVKFFDPKRGDNIMFEISLKEFKYSLTVGQVNEKNEVSSSGYGYSPMTGFQDKGFGGYDKDYNQFTSSHSRIFVKNQNLVKEVFNDDSKLNIDCSNLEKVIKRILKEKNKREEIIEWLELLIPGFENIEIVSEPLSGTDSLVIYEKGVNKPFTKNLLSDGTYNILALLTAIYQSDEPQFLCIEEPENGLNPKVQKELVNLFRQKCEDEGHYIWLNTHSQTIVNQLEAKEIILVDKKDGETKIKQLADFKLHGLKMGEAWLSNALGGGIPW